MSSAAAPHIPVLLGPLLRAVNPAGGLWLDATFGAGGYARGLLDQGVRVLIAVDRDPLAFELAQDWAANYGATAPAAAMAFGTAVPEPGTLGLLIGGVLAGMSLRRRRAV